MNYEKKYNYVLERAKKLKKYCVLPEIKDWVDSVFPELRESKEIKFRKFDIITNGKIEYEVKDIQKNQLGDLVYILYNDNVAKLPLSDSYSPDGSIKWVCEQVDEQFELKQRMEKQQ